MKRSKPPWKNRKNVERIVAEEPRNASAMWLLFYSGTSLFQLELLASVLNDVPPDSPDHEIAEMIEKLVTTPPAEQEWVKGSAPIIGSTPCDPAPGSPLYVLNKFLQGNPCVLQVHGFERADGDIHISATHVPIMARRERDRVLWVLWEVFYRNLDLTRLKKCSVCHRWFVDHSKNKSKTRCSARCTSLRWSWEARKQAGHGKRKAKGVPMTGSKHQAKGESRAKAKKA